MACAAKLVSFLQTELQLNGREIRGISNVRFGVVEHKRIRWDAQGGQFAQTTGVRSAVMGLMLHGAAEGNIPLKTWLEQERQGNFYQYDGTISYPSGLKGTLQCGLMIGWNPLLDIYMNPNELPEHTYLFHFEELKENVAAYDPGITLRQAGSGRPIRGGGGGGGNIFSR